MNYRDSNDYISKTWDQIHKKETLEIQKGFPEIVDIFKKYNVTRVLDLCCGAGRHTYYLAREGFETYGFDISEEGIEIAKSLLKESDLNAKFDTGSMFETLPYDNNFFNGIVSIRSINHGTIEQIRGLIKEIERILESGGLVYVTARKRISKKRRLPFKTIAPRTYVSLEGEEKGIVHYLFTRDTLKKEFNNFKIKKLWIEYGPKDWEAYYSLLGELKDSR